MSTPSETAQIAALQVEVRHLAQNIERLAAAIEKAQNDHETRIRRLEKAVLALLAAAAASGSYALKVIGLI